MRAIDRFVRKHDDHCCLAAAMLGVVIAMMICLTLSLPKLTKKDVVVTPETHIINGVKFRTGLKPGKVVWTKYKIGMDGETHYAKGVVVDLVYEVAEGYHLRKDVMSLVDFGDIIVKMQPEELVSKEPVGD